MSKQNGEAGAKPYRSNFFGLRRSGSRLFEADLVWHSGPTARGSFVQILVLTDMATGWTEFAPLLVREQKLRGHQPTREYVKRRTEQGKSKQEIIRCLKRYVAREIYHYLCAPKPFAEPLNAS